VEHYIINVEDPQTEIRFCDVVVIIVDFDNSNLPFTPVRIRARPVFASVPNSTLNLVFPLFVQIYISLYGIILYHLR
jgi:hypothetical protein